MKTRCVVTAIILGIAVPHPSGATTYFVKPDGTGDFETIQAAIEFAANGDIVELMAVGTYTLEGNRDIDFLGKAITVRSQGGVPDSCIIDCEGSAADPHRAFIFQNGEGNDSVIEGVTIQNGYAPGPANDGGGVYFGAYTGPSIMRCAFLDNHADHDGGGAYCDSDADASFQDCTFSSNTAVHDGGGVSVHSAPPSFVGCTFAGNSARIGGGLFGVEPHLPGISITDCVFSNNSAFGDGGGGVGCDGLHFQISNCQFLGNSANVDGGAVYGTGSAIELYLTVTHSTFQGNTAGSGGGLWAEEVGAGGMIADCQFIQNFASHEGGAVFYMHGGPTLYNVEMRANEAELGGGLCLFHTWDLVQNCVLTSNIGTQGGGAYIYGDASGGGPVPFLGCTIAGNSASVRGGGMSIEGGLDATLTNCTVVGNAALTGSGLDCEGGEDDGSDVFLENVIIAFGQVGEAVFCNPGEPDVAPSFAYASCSDVFGNGGGDWVGSLEGQEGEDGNFSEDPLFCTVGMGGFFLRDDSPCAPASSPPGCGLVGADSVGCSVTAVEADNGRIRRPLAIQPNPFTSQTIVTYILEGGAHVSSTVSDVTGRTVLRRPERYESPGIHTIAWDGTTEMGNRLPAGVYYWKLSVEGQSSVARVVLVR